MEGLTYLNPILSSLAEDNLELAEPICQNMLEQGSIPMDCHCVIIEGTLTFDFDVEDD
jgi:hypothetical protein